MKPRINVKFDNGTIGAVSPLAVGLLGLLASAEAVADTFELGTAYSIKSVNDARKLGLVDSIANHRLYKTIAEFYAEAGEGTELYIMGVEKTKKLSEFFKAGEDEFSPAENLLNAANGNIRGLITSYDPDSSVVSTVTGGIDADVLEAANEAQLLFENYSAKKYAPFFTLLEGYNFSGNKVELTDLTTYEYDSVGILIGDTEKRSGTTASKGAAIGVLGGRIARSFVRENIGKVRNGALSATELFVKDVAAENYDTEALYEKGYITFVTHQGRAGYYFMDDPLACAEDNDYHYLSRRRTINEAYRLAYQANLDYLLDEVPVNADGTINAAYAKSIEQAVESKIIAAIGDDLQNVDGDYGVQCFVDASQNIVRSSKLNEVIRIRPWGYNRWIDVLVGYEIQN
ncbi:DUF2586 family protein [Weeksella virosa]|uniref:DUF2586 family protein n=1 Tax=Weeksella virosa TaxID=1014 RepID=UPI0025563BBF|nr:DUF2586 family protein [Weeksella virosa]MDK7376071.1 DUF2586 family protein [Weeksella virosa]